MTARRKSQRPAGTGRQVTQDNKQPKCSTEQADYLAQVPASARGFVVRALAGEASPRGAIKAYCLACSHFDRAEIAACPVTRCLLHSYRPFKEPGSASGVAEASRRGDGIAAEGI